MLAEELKSRNRKGGDFRSIPSMVISAIEKLAQLSPSTTTSSGASSSLLEEILVAPPDTRNILFVASRGPREQRPLYTFVSEISFITGIASIPAQEEDAVCVLAEGGAMGTVVSCRVRYIPRKGYAERALQRFPTFSIASLTYTHALEDSGWAAAMLAPAM